MGIAVRDYRHIEGYLDRLALDIYPQPPDDKQLALAQAVVNHWVAKLPGLDSILDVGCGQGHALPMLSEYAGRVEGVTLGSDFGMCDPESGLRVREEDMSFLPYGRGEFTLIFARHVLEHSPMPLITLMEWRRVASRWLILIVPSLDSFDVRGRNHYHMLLPGQWEVLLEHAGWDVIWYEDDGFEHRFFCEKVKDGPES